MDASAPPAPQPQKARRPFGSRLLGFLAVAWVVGLILENSTKLIYETEKPAGFGRGLLHGAIMPLAMPNLMVGRDMTIYSPVNTGRTYKLGFTVGVNGCGLLFFGFFFWRVKRLRQDWRLPATDSQRP